MGQVADRAVSPVAERQELQGDRQDERHRARDHDEPRVDATRSRGALHPASVTPDA